MFEFKIKKKITPTLTKYFLLKTKDFLVNICKCNRGLSPLFAGSEASELYDLKGNEADVEYLETCERHGWVG